MMICEKCGAVFEYPNSRKDCDTGYTEELCPECHSEYIVRAVQCELCGEWIQEDAAYGYGHAVCENCVKENDNDLDLLLDSSRDETSAYIELPSIFQEFYSTDDIIELLMQDMKKRQEAGYIDTKSFVRWHMNDIADQLVKK